MSKNQIPCRDCITLPICRNVFKHTKRHAPILVLVGRCSIIEDYLATEILREYEEKIREIKAYMKSGVLIYE
jgi:ATP/maltotriose-dependent transcriptional regulator MalT